MASRISNEAGPSTSAAVNDIITISDSDPDSSLPVDLPSSPYNSHPSAHIEQLARDFSKSNAFSSSRTFDFGN